MPRACTPATGTAKTLVPAIEKQTLFKERPREDQKTADVSTIAFPSVELKKEVAGYHKGHHAESSGSFMIKYLYGTVINDIFLLHLPRHVWKLEVVSFGEGAAMHFTLTAPQEMMMNDVLVVAHLQWKIMDENDTVYMFNSMPKELTQDDASFEVKTPSNQHPSAHKEYIFHMSITYQKYHKN